MLTSVLCSSVTVHSRGVDPSRRRPGNPAGSETIIMGRLRVTGRSDCSSARPSGDAACGRQCHISTHSYTISTVVRVRSKVAQTPGISPVASYLPILKY